MEHTTCLVCDSDDATPVISTGAHMYAGDADRFHFVRCNTCGLVYLNPRVEPENLGAYYPPYYLPYRGPSAWGKYAALAEKGLAITDRRRVRVARKALGESTGAGDPGHRPRVLDVGCGKPSFLAALRDDGIGASDGVATPDLTGIDFVDSGWRDDPERWRGIDLVETQPAAYDPGADRKPDLITMWHYLEHDYAPRETLRQMRAIAHAHTQLIIEVPHLDSLPRYRYGADWEGWHAPRHTALYNRSTIGTLLAATGWEMYRYTTAGTLDTFALWWMSAMEKRGIDWSQSMESRFVGFMVGRVLTAPLFRLAGLLPLGVQLVTARPKNS